jgi:predicted DNA binding CopG/RHH family protein
MKKKLPVLKTDEEAERFVETADLTEYDLSQFKPVRFEFAPKTERVNMRLPAPLLAGVKARAARAGMPYQRYIRLALEEALARPEAGERAPPRKQKRKAG